MQSLHSAAAIVEADDVAFPFACPADSDLENRVVSPCGRFESFDYKGSHFEIDWDEIAPPGAESEDEEGTPHEEFMAEMDRYIEELEARRGVAR
jgi:hypothetical protein